MDWHKLLWESWNIRKGNTFGTVAFTSYGLFWWSLVLLLTLHTFTGFAAPSAASMASYFAMWGIFTFAMFFGTLKANRALQFVFGSLAVLFFMLAIGQYARQHIHSPTSRASKASYAASARYTLGWLKS